MENNRIFNFNAGPAALPLPVLKEIQSCFLNFNNTGMSIIETSHRSKSFDIVINSAKKSLEKLLKINSFQKNKTKSKFHILFIQGGASFQFPMIPMNFLSKDNKADYINTGVWSSKAIAQVNIQGKKCNIPASSENKKFSYIPENIKFSDDPAYIHLTSNNTIYGTQFKSFPDTKGIPLIADMSSDILSRPLDMEKFDLIYAGAQKNLGLAGVCLVIIKDTMLQKCNDKLPTMLKYSTYAEKNSMFNTPPCFGIYTISLVLKWIEKEMGTLEKMEQYNIKKAELLYDFIDSTNFYKGTAEKQSRSLMNITFNLPSTELEKKFLAKALKNGLGGLKGHRDAGGLRVSTYNASTIKGIKALIKFMDRFQKDNNQ